MHYGVKSLTRTKQMVQERVLVTGGQQFLFQAQHWNGRVSISAGIHHSRVTGGPQKPIREHTSHPFAAVIGREDENSFHVHDSAGCF